MVDVEFESGRRQQAILLRQYQVTNFSRTQPLKVKVVHTGKMVEAYNIPYLAVHIPPNQPEKASDA